MRYLVVGTSGAGKSTFARRLANSEGCPHVELDAMHWAANWARAPDPEFEAAARAAAAGRAWVIDGNYGRLRPILWPRATHVVWLNFPRSVVFPRVFRRTIARIVSRERLWHGNRETFARSFLSRESILLWSLGTFATNARRYADLRAGGDHGHLEWVELRAPAEARAYLDRRARPIR